MQDLVYISPLNGENKSADWLNELRNQSGAYVIRDSRTHEVLYVGESHTGRLAKTIKRHFYHWPDETDRRHFTVNPKTIEVAVRVTPPNSAGGAQDNLIQRLNPSRNILL